MREARKGARADQGLRPRGRGHGAQAGRQGRWRNVPGCPPTGRHGPPPRAWASGSWELLPAPRKPHASLPGRITAAFAQAQGSDYLLPQGRAPARPPHGPHRPPAGLPPPGRQEVTWREPEPAALAPPPPRPQFLLCKRQPLTPELLLMGLQPGQDSVTPLQNRKRRQAWRPRRTPCHAGPEPASLVSRQRKLPG